MSKILTYVAALFMLIVVGGFAFFAITPAKIDQTEVVLDVPAERFE